MKKPKPITKASSVRLTITHWAKLRELMRSFGRVWLERAIDREHAKLKRDEANG